jgi:hypothetical protein
MFPFSRNGIPDEKLFASKIFASVIDTKDKSRASKKEECSVVNTCFSALLPSCGKEPIAKFQTKKDL